MPSFYARVTLNYSYARKMIEEQKSPFSDFVKGFPAEAGCVSVNERFTFGIFRLDSSDADSCRGMIKEVWDRTSEGDGGDISVLLTPDDGSSTAELMRVIYNVYYGVEPYQALVTELTAAIPLLKERGALGAVRKRNYLFAIDGGCGFTRLLSSFGDYLHKMQVYESTEEERTKYIEYKLSKESGNGFTGVDDFIGALREGTEKPDLSIIGVDISSFLEGQKFDELRNVLRRMERYQNDYIFAFRIPFLEKKAMDDVASVIADVLYLKVIQIPPLHDAVMYDFAWDCIRDLGYSCDSTLAETLFARIRKEKQDGRFYGFKTVEKIINEAVLIKANRDAAEEYAGRTVDRKTIMPADVEALNPKEKAKKTGYDELAELIGMEKITQKVREIVAQVRYSMKQEKVDRPCIHMRFVGSPGTGKTTVARIIGQIFREEGILRKGAFMEYSARSLCAEYVGQTAVRTAAICRDAYGSVLFIDEAYALYDGSRSSNDYGREALTTLISEMENHRDDMLVIMAGYTDDMETLMQGNAGLRSRMPFMIEFPNYTRTQLYEIFMLMVRKNFDYEPGLEEEVRKFFDSISQEYYDSHEFANARFVRNLYERTWSKGATRAALEGLPRLKLLKQDFIAASGEKEFGEKLQKETRIGF
ncbi:MAG: AAA family ATPase [Clostridia bacterium]|nr:AAA family ATPase [Clostridia bacterium]